MTTNNHIFQPDESSNSTRWLVQGMFPLGDTIIIAAQPSVGKSFFVEALATSIAFDTPFLNFGVTGGHVLLVDEDTPSDRVKSRLAKYSYGHKSKSPYNIYLHSKEGHSIDDGSLVKLIEGYKDLRLTIIDCLVSVSGKADLDRTIDMKYLTSFIQAVSRNDMTIIINHHISTKKAIIPELAMTCANPQALLMNNTRIVSASDSLYILASPDTDGILRTLLVRPVSRRVTLPTKIFSARLTEDDTTIDLSYGEPLDFNKNLNRNERRLLELINLGEEMTVKDIWVKAKMFYSDKTLREVLHSLEDKKYMELFARKGKGGSLYYKRIL